jgi:hypothetical protein
MPDSINRITQDTRDMAPKEKRGRKSDKKGADKKPENNKKQRKEVEKAKVKDKTRQEDFSLNFRILNS